MNQPPDSAPPSSGIGALVSSVDAVLQAVNRWLLIVVLAVMVVLVLTGVVMRYVTSGSLVWAEELSRYLMVWLTFLGMGPVLRVGGHMAVDSLMAALSVRGQQILRAVVVLCIAGFCLYLIYAGWGHVGRAWRQTTPVLGIPFAWVALAGPVGFVLTLWHLSMVVGGFVRDGLFEMSDDLDPQQASGS